MALSSTEAEYAAIAEAAKDVLFLRNLAEELSVTELTSVSTTFFNDNQSAQYAIKNENVSAKIKHVDIKIHFVRDLLRKGLVNIEFLESKQMIADVLTKLLPFNKHKFCIEGLGLSEKQF